MSVKKRDYEKEKKELFERLKKIYSSEEIKNYSFIHDTFKNVNKQIHISSNHKGAFYG